MIFKLNVVKNEVFVIFFLFGLIIVSIVVCKVGCVELNLILYNVVVIIIFIKLFEIVKIIIVKIVIYNVGSIMNIFLYLFNSFFEIGFIIVNVIVYIRKKVFGFIWIDDVNNGKKVVIFLYVNDKKNIIIVIVNMDFLNSWIFFFFFCGVNGIFVINDNMIVIKDNNVVNKNRLLNE